MVCIVAPYKKKLVGKVEIEVLFRTISGNLVRLYIFHKTLEYVTGVLLRGGLMLLDFLRVEECFHFP